MVPSWRPLGIAPGERGRQGGREGGRVNEGEMLRYCGHTFKSSSGAVTSGMVPSSSNP